jgi:hypothetical protein
MGSSNLGRRPAAPPPALAQVPYKDDPTIFAWAVTWEPVPFGRKKWEPVGESAPRDVDNVVAFILNAASLLKAAGVKQLVSTGGLLHMDKVPLTKRHERYYKALWASPNISFASVHVYVKDFFAPASYLKWAAAARDLGKPFVLEEAGFENVTCAKKNMSGTQDHSTRRSGPPRPPARTPCCCGTGATTAARARPTTYGAGGAACRTGSRTSSRRSPGNGGPLSGARARVRARGSHVLAS